MIANIIVDNLLENGEFYGPPEPDAFQKAVGTSRHLRDLTRQKDQTLGKLDIALQIERQLKKAGVTRDQVDSYIRADQQDPKAYSVVKRETVPNPRDPERGFITRRVNPTYPPDALVGMRLNDGREIMFDFPAIGAR